MKRPGKPRGQHYLSHQAVDTDHGIILDVTVTPGDVNDSVPYLEQIERINSQIIPLQAAAADAAYDFPLAHRVLDDLGIAFFVRHQKHGDNSKTEFKHDDFRYDEENDLYVCPQGNPLRRNILTRTASGLYWQYIAQKADCKDCPLRHKCLSETDRRGARKLEHSYFRPAVSKHLDRRGEPVYQDAPMPVYETLLKLIADKDYFVITTNVDHCFQKAGFDKKRLFYTQGDYGLFQCSEPCCQETFDNEAVIREMVKRQEYMKVPTELLPVCPHCGKPLTMNLRSDNKFVEDEGWHRAAERYENFLPELFSRIYFAQTTEGVQPISGHEDESRAVLAAVQAALNKALTASKPTLSVSPEKTTYANADEVTVTLDCPTEGAEIYYTVDNSNTLTGSTVSDPTRTGKKYENQLSVSIGNIAGGTLYIRAAARKDGKWSGIVRKDLTFAKGVKENAFVVDGKNYRSWSDAVAAVNAANGGTIELNDDVQLTEEDKLPDVACTIRSADGETKYRLSGSLMTMNADLTLSNISYALGNLYANGHDLTIANDVKTAWSWTGYNLYAGSTAESTAAGTQHISVQAGNFAVIASGRGSTTHKANVDVSVGGTAEVELAGAYMGAKLDGDVRFTVADSVKLNQFPGEQSGGTVTGGLTLIISGAPTMSTGSYSTYKASVNKDSFGTLDLTSADADFITANRDKFTGFATVKPTA